VSGTGNNQARAPAGEPAAGPAEGLAMEEMRLLYRTSQRISTAMEVDDVIRAYLEEVGAHSGCVCSVALYEFDAEGNRSSIVVRARWSPGEGLVPRSDRYPYAYDDLDPLLDAGQTVTIRDVHTDPRASETLREAQKDSGCPALAMIPLLERGARLGLVVLSHPSVTDWPADVLQPYQTTAAQLATAIDSRRQHSLLMERIHEVAALQERQRIARDLHDSVTQLLFSITLIAGSLGSAWKRDPAEGERRVDRLLGLSRSALAEMRALLTGWRASMGPSEPGEARAGILQARQEDLPTALRRHLAHVTADGLEARLDASAYTPQAPEHEEALFRIAQEALNNVMKHAGARRVVVRLLVDSGEAVITVRDDGRGFSARPESGAGMSTTNRAARSAGSFTGCKGGVSGIEGASGGLGLSTMRERVAALGGTIRFDSQPGRGTTVEARLPRREAGQGAAPAPPPAYGKENGP